MQRSEAVLIPTSRNGRAKPGRNRLIAYRVLVAIAAACFVGAFAIAALAPFDLTLAGGLLRLDQTAASWLQPVMSEAGQAAFHPSWHIIVVPFLVRPAWILPAMIGLISAGLAVTVGRVVGKQRA